MNGGEMMLPLSPSPEARGTLPTPVSLAYHSLREYVTSHPGQIPLGRHALFANALVQHLSQNPQEQQQALSNELAFFTQLEQAGRSPNAKTTPGYDNARPAYNSEDPHYGLRAAWTTFLLEMNQAKTPPTPTDLDLLQRYLSHKEREAMFQRYPDLEELYKRVRRGKEKRLSRNRKIIIGLGITAIVLGSGAIGIERLLKAPIIPGGIRTSEATVIPPDQIEASGMGDRSSQQSSPTEQVPPVAPTIIETPLPTPAGIESPEPEKSDFLSKLYEMITANRNTRSVSDPDYSRRIDTELNRNRINICMNGFDDVDGAPHLDAIVVLSFDLNTNKATVLRIPRDLHAPEIDDMLGDPSVAWRINGAYYAGGWDGVRKVLEDATGLSQDFCFFYKFDGFRKYIDAIGGIEVELDQQFVDNYSSIFATAFPQASPLTSGVRHLNGESALWYSRVRKNDNDYYRGARQQQVIEATAVRLSWLLENAGDNKTLLLKFLSTVVKEHLNGEGVYAGEISLDDLIKLGKIAISDPKSVHLSGISIDKFDPGWGKLVTEGVLFSDYWQLYPIGQSMNDPADPLDYWKFLRDKIRERLINPQGSSITPSNPSRISYFLPPHIVVRRNPATGWQEYFDTVQKEVIDASLAALRNTPRAGKQARESGNARLNQAQRQARVNIPRPRGGGVG